MFIHVALTRTGLDQVARMKMSKKGQITDKNILILLLLMLSKLSTEFFVNEFEAFMVALRAQGCSYRKHKHLEKMQKSEKTQPKK